MDLEISPVDPHQEVELPHPWDELCAKNFHPDLVLRAKGMLLHSARNNQAEFTKAFLSWVGDGFINPFQFEKYHPSRLDKDYSLKLKALEAIQSCADFYGNRVSSVVWDSFASLFTRPNPQEAGMIRDYTQYMSHPWYLIDSVLHATGLVYNFMLHIQSELNSRTGMVFDHNCDCSHVIQAPPDGVTVSAFSPASKRDEASAALFSHLFCQAKLICMDHLPFELGITQEWHLNPVLV